MSQLNQQQKSTIAILGGTGGLAYGLASRLLTAGYKVIIGSRSKAKAGESVAALQALLSERGIEELSVGALDNKGAADEADIIVLTVPFAHQVAVLNGIKDALKGKILIDATVPLVPPKVARVQLPPEGSAGQIAQNILGEDVQVVSAFQNVAAHQLQKEADLDCDVLVCGNKKAARETVIGLINDIGLRGFHGGPICNAAAVEALTSLLIFVNKQYDCHSGIRLTGLGS